MTVQVIGIDPTNILYTSCRHCSSRLSYIRNDIKSYVHKDYGGGSDLIKYISCAHCGKDVEVK